MARKFTVSLDLNKNELLNARLQNLSSDPSSPVAGQIYYNTSAKETRFYDGTQWIAGGATKYGLDSAKPSPSKGGILYVATDTQTLYIDNGSSWVQISVNPQDLSDAINDHNSTTSGVHGITGNVVGTTDSQTLTNKTIGDVLTFNDGSNSSTIDVDGNNLYITANNNLQLSTANGNIELQPDGYANVYGDRIVTETASQSLSNKTFLGQTNFQSGGGAGGTANYIDVNNNTGELIVHSGYALNIVSNNNLIIESNSGDIVLNPDGYAKVNNDVIVTQNASQTLTNKTLTDAVLGNNLDADGYKIVNLDSPTSSTDAANKAYVDSQISGANLSFYGTTDEVEVSKVGNDVTIGLPDDVTITGEITAASGHITGNLQIDGNVNIEGTLNAVNRTEVNIEDNTIVLNTNFTGTPTANAGITVNRGDSADVSVTWNETNDQWTLTNNGSNYHAIARKFAMDIGNGVLTTIPVTHNLGTKDVTVQIFENNADYNQVEADVQHTSLDEITVKFAVAPSTNEYRVVVVG